MAREIHSTDRVPMTREIHSTDRAPMAREIHSTDRAPMAREIHSTDRAPMAREIHSTDHAPMAREIHSTGVVNNFSGLRHEAQNRPTLCISWCCLDLVLCLCSHKVQACYPGYTFQLSGLSVQDIELVFLLHVCHREEGVVAIHLATGVLKTCCGLGLAPRCEPSTYHPLDNDFARASLIEILCFGPCV